MQLNVKELEQGAPKTEDVLVNALKFIQQRFLEPYQEKIKNACERAEAFYLTMDIPCLERLYYRQFDILAVERAIKAMQRLDFWESMYKGFVRYIGEHPVQRDTFNEMIDVVEITFDEKKIETIVELVEEENLLRFALCVSNITLDTWTPEVFYNTVKEILDDYIDRVKQRRQQEELSIQRSSVQESNVEPTAFVEEIIETGKPLEDLKRIALSKTVLNGDLSKFVRFVNQSEFWQATPQQQEIFDQCKKIIEQRYAGDIKRERFIKAWIIIKINREGNHQERIFLLSDQRFHTLKYSKKNKNFPEKRIKSYNISDVHFMDVARYKATRTDKSVQPYGIAIYLRNGAKNVSEELEQENLILNDTSELQISPDEHESGSSRPRSRRMMKIDPSTLDQREPPRRSQSTYEVKTFPSEIAARLEPSSVRRSDSADTPLTSSVLASPTKEQPNKKPNWAVKKAKKVLKKFQKASNTESLEKDDQVRPLVKNYVSHVFGAPLGLFQSNDQKDYFDEIAWSIFAVMCANRGSHPLKPFYGYPITKPRMLSLDALLHVVGKNNNTVHKNK
jgi:SepF-like predicted cell division protein (DUF552 family)